MQRVQAVGDHLTIVQGAGNVITAWNVGNPQNGGSIGVYSNPILHRHLLVEANYYKQLSGQAIAA